ncbi:hypothetical protein ACF0H5_018567 [Mactra antiquata]
MRWIRTGTFSTVLVIICMTSPTVSQKDCSLDDECSCTFTDGSGKVDLTSLGNTDDTPKFKDVLFKDEGYYYSYNPCGGFTEGDCQDASACVINEDKSEQQQIGDSSNAAFKYDDSSNNVIVAYTSGHGVLRLTTVNLVCDKSACTPSFTPMGEQGAGQFEMTLTTVCACPDGCDASGPKHCSGSGAAGGLSGGTILCILFISLLFVYLVAGTIFMKMRLNATGSDLIPNKNFWFSLPGLILHGFKFTCSKIRRQEYVPTN